MTGIQVTQPIVPGSLVVLTPGFDDPGVGGVEQVVNQIRHAAGHDRFLVLLTDEPVIVLGPDDLAAPIRALLCGDTDG